MHAGRCKGAGRRRAGRCDNPGMPTPDDATTARAPELGEKALLRRLAGGPVSGDVLAREAGLTRAAMWKRIEALRAAGIGIAARPGRGYALEAPVDLLEAGVIADLLPAGVRAAIHGPGVAWTIDSTSSELLRRRTPPTGVEVLLAERQTGGRGRLGRAWASPLAANLYLSLARTFDGGLARLGGLGLVAGVAATEALHALGYDRVRLKWPNDLVVVAPVTGGLRKLGGLLVEGGGEHAGPVRAVVGLGLNVRMPATVAAAIDQPWCDLAALGPAAPSRNVLAAALVAGLVPALAQFDREGLAPFLSRYAALDALAGRPVEVRAGSTVQAGIALGLAPDGALRVEVDGVERHVHAGEASLRARGAAA